MRENERDDGEERDRVCVRSCVCPLQPGRRAVKRAYIAIRKGAFGTLLLWGADEMGGTGR